MERTLDLEPDLGAPPSNSLASPSSAGAVPAFQLLKPKGLRIGLDSFAHIHIQTINTYFQFHLQTM